MIILRLAWRSLANRWVTALLTVLAIAVSVMLLLGVEKVRTGARSSFANTISGTICSSSFTRFFGSVMPPAT